MKWDSKENWAVYRELAAKAHRVYRLMDFVAENNFSDELMNKFAELLNARQEEANSFLHAHCA